MIPRRLQSDTSLSISTSIVSPAFRSRPVRSYRLPIAYGRSLAAVTRHSHAAGAPEFLALASSKSGHDAGWFPLKLGNDLVMGPVEPGRRRDIVAESQLYHTPA